MQAQDSTSYSRKCHLHDARVLHLVECDFSEDGGVFLRQAVQSALEVRIHDYRTDCLKHWHTVILVLPVNHWHGMHEDLIADIFDAWLVAGSLDARNLYEFIFSLHRDIVPSAF